MQGLTHNSEQTQATRNQKGVAGDHPKILSRENKVPLNSIGYVRQEHTPDTHTPATAYDNAADSATATLTAATAAAAASDAANAAAAVAIAAASDAVAAARNLISSRTRRTRSANAGKKEESLIAIKVEAEMEEDIKTKIKQKKKEKMGELTGGIKIKQEADSSDVQLEKTDNEEDGEGVYVSVLWDYFQLGVDLEQVGLLSVCHF